MYIGLKVIDGICFARLRRNLRRLGYGSLGNPSSIMEKHKKKDEEYEMTPALNVN